MSLVQKLYERFILSSIKNNEVVPDVAAWSAFMNKIPMPKDPYEASYAKYLCRMSYISKPKAIVLNIAALIRLIAALPCLLRPIELSSNACVDKLVIIKRPTVKPDDIMPTELLEEYKQVTFIELPTPKIGTISHMASNVYWACVRRHPLSFYYLLYVLKEFSIHSFVVNSENPKAVAVYVNERNFASPLLTMLYEYSCRELLSFMHGEYLLQLMLAYTAFSKFYVWDTSYIEMFEKDLRCNCGQYEVYTPLKLKKKWNLEEVKPDHFCTYYLSGESERSIRALIPVFNELNSYGFECRIRPHPRDSHWGLIKNIIPNSMIEDATSVDIETSLGATEYAIGLCSTVLSEAWAEGRPVVIDDISDPDAFSNLRERRYIGLSREHILFSDLISSIRHDFKETE